MNISTLSAHNSSLFEIDAELEAAFDQMLERLRCDASLWKAGALFAFRRKDRNHCPPRRRAHRHLRSCQDSCRSVASNRPILSRNEARTTSHSLNVFWRVVPPAFSHPFRLLCPARCRSNSRILRGRLRTCYPARRSPDWWITHSGGRPWGRPSSRAAPGCRWPMQRQQGAQKEPAPE